MALIATRDCHTGEPCTKKARLDTQHATDFLNRSVRREDESQSLDIKQATSSVASGFAVKLLQMVLRKACSRGRQKSIEFDLKQNPFGVAQVRENLLTTFTTVGPNLSRVLRTPT